VVALLNALALAADEHTRHVLRDFTRFDQCSVRSVPAGVVGVVSCGSSLSVIALPTGGTVQHDLVGPSKPVLINVERGRSPEWAPLP